MVKVQMIEQLKEAELFFTAGALAQQMGLALNYGCHVGMRSTRDAAVAEFRRGYLAAGNKA